MAATFFVHVFNETGGCVAALQPNPPPRNYYMSYYIKVISQVTHMATAVRYLTSGKRDT